MRLRGSLRKSDWLVCISSLIPRGLGFQGWFRIPSPCSDQASRPSPAGGRGARQALGPGRWGEGLVVHISPFLQTGPAGLVRWRGGLRKSDLLLVRAPGKALWGPYVCSENVYLLLQVWKWHINLL